MAEPWETPGTPWYRARRAHARIGAIARERARELDAGCPHQPDRMLNQISSHQFSHRRVRGVEGGGEDPVGPGPERGGERGSRSQRTRDPRLASKALRLVRGSSVVHGTGGLWPQDAAVSCAMAVR